MTETTARRARPTVRLQVVRTEQLTPHMVRVIAGGPGFADFVANAFTDAYVKLVLPRPDVAYPEPFDMAEVRATMPREQWPAIRTYTVRGVDEAAGEIAIDVVQHGDSRARGPVGGAGPARRRGPAARPGRGVRAARRRRRPRARR